MRESVRKTIGLKGETAVIVGSTASAPHLWRKMGVALSETHNVLVPHLWNVMGEPSWRGGDRFSLMDDALILKSQLDEDAGPVHLIGHSYGGAVALRFAREWPERVASLTLFEPAMFGVLRFLQDNGGNLFKEVYNVARMATTAAARSEQKSDVRHVVNFWHGGDAWSTMTDAEKEGVFLTVPKMGLEFLATLWEEPAHADYAALDIPTLIFRGADASIPMQRVAYRLSRVMPQATLCTFAGAGHMLPITHAEQALPLVINHIRNKRHARRIAA